MNRITVNNIKNKMDAQDFDNVYEFLYQISVDNVEDVRACAKEMLIKFFHRNDYLGRRSDEENDFDYEYFFYKALSNEYLYNKLSIEDRDSKFYQEIIKSRVLSFPESIEILLHHIWRFNVVCIKDAAKLFYKIVVLDMNKEKSMTLEYWDLVMDTPNEIIRKQIRKN